MHTYKSILIAMLVIVVVFVTSCSSKSTVVPPNQLSNRSDYDAREQLVYQFIVNKLQGEYGVYTNYLDSNQESIAATGHEVLSESSGLMMRYYALTKQADLFEQAWAIAKSRFNQASSFSYRYSPLHNKKYTVNAAIDDLRIIRALLEAAEVFDNKKYEQEALALGERFLTFNVQDDKLFDFYDELYKFQNTFITLCYIDLKTLNRINDKRTGLMDNMLQISKNGYISDHFPFYETRYDYETNTYQSENINTVESMLTILSLVEVGEYHSKSIEFIKKQVEQGALYGQYTKDGKATTDIQSTAIYAIAAMIGSELGDSSLYKASIHRMEQYQVLEQDDELYGAFGDAYSKQAYSFDNLMAILAYAY